MTDKSDKDVVTIDWKDGSYTGEVSDGVPHGQGSFTHPDGEKYVGEFEDGKANGQGTFTWHDAGTSYIGGFKDGLFHGQGTETLPRGQKYVGGYKNDKKHGQGTLTYSDEFSFSGEFKDDAPWQGTEYDPDGNVTATYSEGAWKEN